MVINVLYSLLIVLALFCATYCLGLVIDLLIDIWYECRAVLLLNYLQRLVSSCTVFIIIAIDQFISYNFDLMRLNDRFRYFHVLIILKDNSLGEILRSGPHQLIYILINTYFTLCLMKTKLLITHRYLTSFHRLKLTLALHLLLSIVMI